MNKIVFFLKLFGFWIISWFLGSFANGFNCYFSQKENAGDCFIQTAIFSFLIIMPFFPILYLPTLFSLRKILKGVKPKIIFILVSAFLFFIPLGLLYLPRTSSFSNFFRVLFNPFGEFQIVLFFTGLFFGMFFVNILPNQDFQNEFEDDNNKLKYLNL